MIAEGMGLTGPGKQDRRKSLMYRDGICRKTGKDQSLQVNLVQCYPTRRHENIPGDSGRLIVQRKKHCVDLAVSSSANRMQ